MFGRNKSTAEKSIEQDQDRSRIKWQQYLIAILFILVGVLFIMFKEIDMSVVCKIFAAVFAVSGVFSIISYIVRDVDRVYYRLDLASGVMALFATLLFITGQDAVSEYFPVIAGAILLGNGVIKLQHSIDMKRIDRKMKKVTEMWLVVMIFALIGIAAGFITVYLTPEKERTMFILIGIALIVAGASDVFTHIVFARKVKLYRSGDYLVEETEPAKEEAVIEAHAVQEEALAPAVSELPAAEPADEATVEITAEATATDDDSDDDKVLFEVEMPQFSNTETDDTDKQA